jgi:hypothetical protein
VADFARPVASTTRPGPIRDTLRPLLSDRTTLGLLVALLCGAGWLQLRSVLHHDPAWLIHGTEVFLDGGRLYRDVFELNPPLIFYLTVPPVWLARSLQLFDLDVFVVYVVALITLSLSIAGLVLRYASALPAGMRNGILLAAGVALAICPAGNFGQREHLMLVLALPYLLLAAGRARQVPCAMWLAGAVGVMAALGFALKPHFLLIPFAAECYIVACTGTLRRLLRTETLGLGAAILLYLEAIVWFTPDYLTTIVPFGMAVYEGGFDSPLLAVLACPATLLLPLVLTLQLATRRNLAIPQPGDILCIAASGFFVIYVMQMKGWSYQAYPLDATLFLGLAVVLLQSVGVPHLSRLAIAIGVLLAAVGVNDGMQRYRNAFMAEMAPIVAGLPKDASIYVFTAKVSEAFPLVNYSGIGWSSRFDTFWLLPGLLMQPAPTPEIEKFLRNAVVTDLTRRPPALIFVDVAPAKAYFGGRTFDYIRYFSADPRFAALWAEYQPLTRIGHFLVYRQHSPTGTT